MNKNTYVEDGLLKFNRLKGDRLQILTTFDTSIWGNMNPYYAKTDEQKKIIEENDKKIADVCGVKTSFVLTTPPEDTMIDLDDKSIKYLEGINKADDNGYKYILARANAAILYPQDTRYSYIIAPADCPVFAIVPSNKEFIVLIHLGAPQVMQGLHNKILTLLSNKFKDLELKGSDVFITPYICKDHYSVKKDKYDMYKNVIGELLDDYTQVKYHEVYGEDSYYIDFISMAKKELEEKWGITKFIDSEICSYESAKEGSLFSHKYVQELEKRKENGEDVNPEDYKGGYNVILSI